jgi:dTDP-glucose 4,6-dehydratase
MKKKLPKVSKNIKIKFVKDRPGHDIRYALNSKKMLNKFNWKAKTKLNEGLVKTINWYIANLEYFKKISRKEHIKRIGLKT